MALISPQQFFAEYDGRRVIDLSLPFSTPEWRYQCVSLIKEYLRRVFGIEPGAWGNAVDYWTRPHPTLLQLFDKVGPPYREGDIVIVKKGTKFEHIGVAISPSRLMEQNGDRGSGNGLGGDAIRIVNMPVATYGALRPKGLIMKNFNDGDVVNIANATGMPRDAVAAKNDWNDIVYTILLPHIAKVNGERLENPYVNAGDAVNAFRALFGREPNAADLDYIKVKRPWNKQGNYRGYFYDLLANPEIKNAEYAAKLEARIKQLESVPTNNPNSPVDGEDARTWLQRMVSWVWEVLSKFRYKG